MRYGSIFQEFDKLRVACGLEAVRQRDAISLDSLLESGGQYCLYMRLKRLGLIPNNRVAFVAHIDNFVSSRTCHFLGGEAPLRRSLPDDAGYFIHDLSVRVR